MSSTNWMEKALVTLAMSLRQHRREHFPLQHEQASGTLEVLRVFE